MNKLATKYLVLLLIALVLINLFRFVLTIYTGLNDLDPMDAVTKYLPYAIGLLFCVVMLFDRKKFSFIAIVCKTVL